MVICYNCVSGYLTNLTMVVVVEVCLIEMLLVFTRLTSKNMCLVPFFVCVPDLRGIIEFSAR